MPKFLHRLKRPDIETDASACLQEASPQQSAIASFAVRLIGSLFFVLVILIVLMTIEHEIKNPIREMVSMYVFIVAVVLAAIFFPKQYLSRIYGYIRSHRWLSLSAALVALLLGFAARFGFLALEYAPVSDPGQFFQNAATLAQTGHLAAPAYIGMFPFYYAYVALLAGMFHVTGSSLLGVILLNTIFDVIAALLLGHLIYLIAKSRKWAIFAALFWWISPFNIIFCVVSLPIIVVNAAILIVLVLLIYLFKSTSRFWQSLGLSASLAVALAVEDAFRPITIITIIAIAVYYVILVLKGKRLQVLWNCVLSLVVITSLSVVLGLGWKRVVENATGLPANTHSQGWSVYSGGNYETGGIWSEEDYVHRMRLMEEYEGDHSRAFSQLQQEGVEWWKALGPAKTFMLIIKKALRLGGNTQNMIYNVSSYPFIQKHGRLLSVLRIVCGIYWCSVLGASFPFCFRHRRMGAHDIVVFMEILTIGLFLASLAVEVSPRYFSVFFPIFAVFSVLGLKSALESLPKAPLYLHLRDKTPNRKQEE